VSSAEAPLVLVVDDEAHILRTLETNLRAAGYAVTTAASVADALTTASHRSPDAVVLDLVLPDGLGTDVCERLRSWTDAPIVILSVISEEQEKIAALDAGADDYVTKPFSMDELLARLRAVLRRPPRAGTTTIEIGALKLDLERRTFTRDGVSIPLTPHEFELLKLLARNEGKLLTHSAILRQIWGPEYTQRRQYLRVYVSQLRRKIERDPAHPEYLLTDARVGYRLVRPDPA
jgi:two-component system, OmpR family, KDP operon response regulator KdpE